MTVGEKIKFVRKGRKLTQKQLGEKSGIAEQTIGQYERETLNPKVKTIEKIAVALNVPSFLFLEERIEILEVTETNYTLSEYLPDSDGSENALMLQEIKYAFQQLNEQGKAAAIERVEELAQLPKYQRRKEECDSHLRATEKDPADE